MSIHALPSSALALTIVVNYIAFLVEVHLLGVVAFEEVHLGRRTDPILEVDAFSRLLHILKLVTHLELTLLLLICKVVAAPHLALLGLLARVVLVVVVVVQAGLRNMTRLL